ncbi:Asp-tRNA(Asn)/Glu-tRNA(Gln) amidotransferase subunit GatA [Cryomorphaceae bacterium 1068]|nr:Asp-tRNA(Asn)/Glu-tRNA(Gln) amidotransferase subunit GatA [Cryomorphaceae bacterium 1068]
MKKYNSLLEIQKDLDQNSLELKDLVGQYLHNIKDSADLNIFLEVFEEEALAKAEEISEKFKNGSAGRLAGMVIALKDNICYKDHRVGAASKILDGFESLYDATVTKKLLEEDAIIIGRVNCDEFAMGASNENSSKGVVKNPVNPDHVPGGSSGGSAAAVAANCCLVALGSDTGGSIRQPAAFCGVVGLKPTYGRVSRHGLIAFASSFDQIGPISHSVSDSALVLEIIAGKDEFDTTSASKKVDGYSELTENKPLKIGYIEECMENDALDPEVKKSHQKLIEELKEQGHILEPVHIEELKYLVPAYYVLTTAEASSNLSRYDGIHYGYRSENSHDIDSTYRMSRTEGFGPEVKRRIMLGTFVLSAGYYDAYYAKAQKVRRVIKEKTDKLLSEYDLLLSPTTPSTAFRIGAKSDDPIQMYLEDVFTVHANLAGTPAISLPLFSHPESKLPIGAQFMAGSFREKLLLTFANNLMQSEALKN